MANENIFTKEELAWIQTHKEIKFGADPSWVPFDYVNEAGKHKGISQDYLEEVSRISGLKFSLYAHKTWSEVITDIKAKKVDLVPAVFKNDERKKYLHFSHFYLKLSEYIFTQKKVKRIKSYNEVNHKKIAVVQNYAVIAWLKEHHPSIKLIIKKDLLACIQAVSLGEVYGYIGDAQSSKYIQEQYFITNIKANRIIPDRDPLELYMAVRKDYPLLASIISKSLKRISKAKKAEIFSRYAKNETNKLALKGAYGFGRPPYMYDRSSGKGMEESLVRYALALRGYEISDVRQMPIERGQVVLLDNDDIDFSVGVLEDKNDGLYYSDALVKYENVAVTRKSDAIKLESIESLKNYKVLAWSKAYKMLGSKFNMLFNPQDRPSSYKEVFNQKKQHEIFFKREADVILVDKNIFQWYVNQYGDKYEARQQYEFHHIFPQPSWIKVSFRDKHLRDEFNLGLQALKDSGKYDELVNAFLEINLQKQLDLSTLIAAVSAKYIYENNEETLFKVLNKFHDMKIVRGIEIHSKAKGNASTRLEKVNEHYERVNKFSWGDSELGMIHKSSYFYDAGEPVLVGDIRVYFKVDKLKDIEISYVPSIQNFDDLKAEEYAYIVSIYKRLNLDAEMTKLSIKEQKWVHEHPLISFVGDPSWLPYEAFDKKGKYIGIVAEYLSEVEKITGLKFKRVPTGSWEESIALMKDKKIDMISETTDSKMREYLNFTDAYLENHIVIIMDDKSKYVDSISQIKDKKLVVIKDYGYVHKIQEAYPDIAFIEADNISQALKIVSSGRADALLCTMALGSYAISKGGFINLRIVGKTEFSTSIGYGVQPELKPLVGILNKAMRILDEGKKQEIIKKWILQKYVEKIDYTLVWQILGAAFILLSLFFYWNRQMKKEIGRRKQAEEELQEVNENVHKSIEFSSMIQRALIPDKEVFENFFSDYFSIWKPRDTVGGDIYFFETLRHKDEAILMVIDCTGHGVPGAFVTMLVKAIERNITGYIKKSDEMVSPANLLAVLNRSMKHLLKQHDKTAASNAGFDAGIVYINKQEKILRYAGAEIALYYTQDGAVKMLKGDRQSVGYRTSKIDYIFTDHALKYEDNISLYMTTDGYLDQNGGDKGFPFGKKRFMKLLQEGKDLDMKTLESKLLDALLLYQGNYERNDDIAIVGIKVGSLFQVEESLLTYEGYITQEKLCSFLDEVEEILKDRLNTTKILPKISAILTEQMQNVMSYAKDSMIKGKGGFKSEGHVVVGFDTIKQKYFASSRNKISLKAESPLREKLDKINSLNTQELRDYYKELRKSGSKQHTRGAGLGFLEMAKKSSEPLEYNIQEVDEDYIFEIKVYI